MDGVWPPTTSQISWGALGGEVPICWLLLGLLSIINQTITIQIPHASGQKYRAHFMPKSISSAVLRMQGVYVRLRRYTCCNWAQNHQLIIASIYLVLFSQNIGLVHLTNMLNATVHLYGQCFLLQSNLYNWRFVYFWAITYVVHNLSTRWW